MVQSNFENLQRSIQVYGMVISDSFNHINIFILYTYTNLKNTIQK